MSLRFCLRMSTFTWATANSMATVSFGLFLIRPCKGPYVAACQVRP